MAAGPAGLFPGGGAAGPRAGTSSDGEASARSSTAPSPTGRPPTARSQAVTSGSPDPSGSGADAVRPGHLGLRLADPCAHGRPAAQGVVRHHRGGAVACRGPEPGATTQAHLPRRGSARGAGLDRGGGVFLRPRGPQPGRGGRPVSAHARHRPGPGLVDLPLRPALPAREERPGLGPLPGGPAPKVPGLAAGPGRVQRGRDPGGRPPGPPSGPLLGEISRHLPAETQMYVPRIDAVLRRREGRPLSGLAPAVPPARGRR